MRLLNVLTLLAAGLGGCATGRAVQEGFVTTDDNVRLYYKVVGDGDETVVIPVGLYLEDLLSPLARPGRRLVFYDPRHRGRSGRGDLARASLDRQIADLEQLRAALGIERMAIIGWSGYGMEMAVYTIRHPDRVTRLVQVAAVPPAARIFREAGGDRRAARTDTAALAALERRFHAGEFGNDGAGYCRAHNRLTLPANFADTTLVARVPDVCRWENEWPVNLDRYFEAFLPTLGDYEWRDEIAGVTIPRLVIHGKEDGIPLAGARAWVNGFPSARLLILSPAGHFPMLERPDEFFAAVNTFLAGEWPPRAERRALMDAADSSTAFVDVSVIAMTDSVIREHQTVVVRGASIVAVGDRASVKPPLGAALIDGRGKFLMPGLVDAHVHLLEQGDLHQFVAYGVTTVRNLMGSPAILAWRDSVTKGALVGPRIVTSGPLLAGPQVPWRIKVVPRDPEAARAEVRKQRDEGYDLLKIYDGLPADVYVAIMAEAARLGMRVTGHIPEQVHLAGVLRAHQDIEHTDKIVWDVWGHSFDTTRIDSVVAAIRNAGVFVTPTIASMEQLASINSGGFDSLLSRPEARRVGSATLEFWCDVSSRLRGNRPPRPGVRFNPLTDFQLKVIAAERRAGVPLLAGTDYPNAMLAAGGGLLEELRALHDAGLTPFEALTAATRTAARVIGDATSGVVARGARADLLLLRANPLRSLEALADNEGVMTAGRWFPRAELLRLAPLRDVAPRCPQ